MKKYLFIFTLTIFTCSLALGQNHPQFHFASSGVKYKAQKQKKWGRPPANYSDVTIKMEDMFFLNKNNTIVILYNKQKHPYKATKEEKLTVSQIINNHEYNCLTAIKKTMLENAESRRPKPVSTSAGAKRMSTSENSEIDYISIILNYFNASPEHCSDLVDSTIVLQKCFISTDEYYFRIINNSEKDYYICIIQQDENEIRATFNKTWNDDGIVGLLFYIPESSELSITDFVYYEDGKTQYIPIASETKFNISSLKDNFKDRAPTEVSNPTLKIGLCIK